MATVIELERSGALYRIDPQLGPGRQEFRLIYVSPRVKLWIENDLSSLESTWKIETAPDAQLDALVEEFCAGDPLWVGWQFKVLHPRQHSVWELKTADLRLFGWFTAKDCFVAASADTKDRIETHGLYAGYIGETVQFRDGLNLDAPKFIPGEDPNAVVTDFRYP